MKITIGTKNTANREVKTVEELFDFPAVTLHKKPDTPKGSYKIAFNKACIELLGLTPDDEISITRDLNHPVLLVVTGLAVEKYTLYKKMDFASKPVHECIVKATEINNEVDNHFKAELIEVDFDDKKLKGVALTEIVTPAEPVAEETTETIEATEETQEEAPVVEQTMGNDAIGTEPVAETIEETTEEASNEEAPEECPSVEENAEDVVENTSSTEEETNF